jgi:hypothetical protein
MDWSQNWNWSWNRMKEKKKSEPEPELQLCQRLRMARFRNIGVWRCPLGTRSCRTICVEAVLQTNCFLIWPKTGPKVTAIFFWSPRVFFW